MDTPLRAVHARAREKSLENFRLGIGGIGFVDMSICTDVPDGPCASHDDAQTAWPKHAVKLCQKQTSLSWAPDWSY